VGRVLWCPLPCSAGAEALPCFPCSAGEVTVLPLNQLLFYFTSVQLGIFFALLLSTCVQSVLPKKTCAASQHPATVEVRVASALCPAAQPRRLGSARGFGSFSVTGWRMRLLQLKLLS